jgi:hypothetical protein
MALRPYASGPNSGEDPTATALNGRTKDRLVIKTSNARSASTQPCVAHPLL